MGTLLRGTSIGNDKRTVRLPECHAAEKSGKKPTKENIQELDQKL